MKIPFTGGCMCRAVRYECSAEPVSMGICHCRDCQQATGSAFAAGMLVPQDAITITGDVTYYDVTGSNSHFETFVLKIGILMALVSKLQNGRMPLSVSQTT